MRCRTRQLNAGLEAPILGTWNRVSPSWNTLLDSWIRFESLERRLDSMAQEHRADFRWLLGVMLAGFGTMLAGFGGLLGVMAHGFHWL